MSYTSYSSINNLEEISFVAGTKYTLHFNFYDSAGAAIDISSFTCKWQIAPVGRAHEGIPTLDLTGTIESTNGFYINLDENTASLSGKYIHQPILIDINADEQRPVQGIITIIPKIVPVA